jgi:chorismate synthase
MEKLIVEAAKKKDTLGGVIEVMAKNVPPGLGSYTHWDRRLDGRLVHHLMTIPSVKAVEIGEGIAASSKFGSEVHDEIFYKKGKFVRKTNKAGGIEGGISNGEDIIIRVFHKPIPTLGKPLRTVDINTKKPTKALIERSDICAVPRAGVISESAIAFVLADCILEKFGGDSLKETKRNFYSYIKFLS